MRFIWFWTYWHWSREGFRDGLLLRGPLSGIGSHWDEWFRHDATEFERREIEILGQDVKLQGEFIRWINQSWSMELDSRDNTPKHAVGGWMSYHVTNDRRPRLQGAVG